MAFRSYGRGTAKRTWSVALALLATMTLVFSREGAASGGAAPQERAAPATAETLKLDPFEKGALGVAFGLGILGESWNLNGTREWLLDGTLSAWWAFVNRATLMFEFHATRVFQQRIRNAFVTGLTPVVRFQVLDTSRWDLFAEIGGGVSWSDTTVPARGTRFNYLGLAGLGLSHRVGPQVHTVTGFRWLHLSNNGREGRDRNPDIQALGGYAGVTLAF